MNFSLNQKEQIIKILDDMLHVLKEITEILGRNPATREADKQRKNHEETK
jgi:hypothetical protein